MEWKKNNRWEGGGIRIGSKWKWPFNAKDNRIRMREIDWCFNENSANTKRKRIGVTDVFKIAYDTNRPILTNTADTYRM